MVSPKTEQRRSQPGSTIPKMEQLCSVLGIVLPGCECLCSVMRMALLVLYRPVLVPKNHIYTKGMGNIDYKTWAEFDGKTWTDVT
jgi:hypothetical protein